MTDGARNNETSDTKATWNVEAGGVHLKIAASYRAGSRDLLFFIHGLGCSRDSFRHVWSRRDYGTFSLLAVDLPGFGGSSRPGAFPYAMEDLARVCDAVLERFSECRLHIVAHSMGGAVGLLLSEELLARTCSFANVEGNLVAADCGLVSRDAAAVPYDVFVKELFPAFKSKYASSEGDFLDLGRSDPGAFYRSSVSLVKWSDSGDLLNKFKALTCRKAYFYGARNAGIPALAELGGIEKIEIPDSGHFAMVEQPEAFYGKLRDFVFKG